MSVGEQGRSDFTFKCVVLLFISEASPRIQEGLGRSGPSKTASGSQKLIL